MTPTRLPSSPPSASVRPPAASGRTVRRGAAALYFSSNDLVREGGQV